MAGLAPLLPFQAQTKNGPASSLFVVDIGVFVLFCFAEKTRRGRYTLGAETVEGSGFV